MEPLERKETDKFVKGPKNGKNNRPGSWFRESRKMFFFFRDAVMRSPVSHRTRYLGSWPNKSANWGASPSVLHHVSHCDSRSTREAVKERLHNVASIRVQLRRSKTSLTVRR